MNRTILRLAIPSIFANITVPLVGIVDLAIAGHISDASAIGGIAVGTMLFDLLYWNFGFLRVGTGGMTAQAFGRRDKKAMSDIFSESIMIALMGALFVWLIGWAFVDVVMWCVPCSPEVESFARQYFNVRIWAAPATLSLMVFKGWFIGTQNTVCPMICDITVNVVNMITSYALAVHTPLGAIGVAYGTLVAQYTGLATAIVLLLSRYQSYVRELSLRTSMVWDKLRHMLALNGNLILRSLGFMVVYVGFTTLTSWYGDEALAVGAIMMKLFMFFSYFVDGFAYAGEALVGRFIGEQDRGEVTKAVRRLFVWCLGVGAVFTLLYAVGGEQAVRMMTSDEAVIRDSRPFLFWLVLMPLVSCAAFMWDGIYIGATAGRQVRNCMFFAALGFVVGYVGLHSMIGIQAVYVGYFVHLLARTLYLTMRWKPLLHKVIPVLLLSLLPLSAYSQEVVDYQPVDSAYMADLEQMMSEMEKMQKVRDAVRDYEEVLERRERRLNIDGYGYLLRGVVGLSRDDHFREALGTNHLQPASGKIGDYAVAMSPLAVTWGMRALGVESSSKMPRMVLSNSLALGMTFGLTTGLKAMTDVARPDGSADNSMPSRHVAFAFASATILHREYGHISPFVSIGGYSAAVATQYLRVAHRAHWASDLYIGAGIGTVATNISYFLADRILGKGAFHRPRLTMADIERTLRYNACPSGLSLVTGMEWGHEDKILTANMLTAGVEYSAFVNQSFAFEAMGRVATAYSLDEESGTTGNIDFCHLNAGVKYSLLVTPNVRMALRGYAGGRYMSDIQDLVSARVRPQVGVGCSVDFIRTGDRYAIGASCDYNHTFSHWFANRWVVNMLWKIVI